MQKTVIVGVAALASSLLLWPASTSAAPDRAVALSGTVRATLDTPSVLKSAAKHKKKSSKKKKKKHSQTKHKSHSSR